jgi:hypothetical protein
MRVGLLSVLVGLLLVGLLSAASYSRFGPRLAPADGPIVRLADGQSVSQPLVIDAPSLVGVRVALLPPANPGAAAIRLRLRQLDSGLPDLASVELPAGSVEDNQASFSFRLADRLGPYTATNRLELIVEALDLPATSELVLLGGPLQPGSEPLRVDGTPYAELGLSVTPIYEQRLIDHIWPISEMASGRPGLFGWPLLYPLLAYSYCVGLSYTLYNVVRHLQSKHNDIDAG